MHMNVNISELNLKSPSQLYPSKQSGLFMKQGLRKMFALIAFLIKFQTSNMVKKNNLIVIVPHFEIKGI